MPLTHDDVRKILEILENSDCEDVYLEFGDLKIELHKQGDSENSSRPVDAKNFGNGEQGAPVSVARRNQAQQVTIPEGITPVTAPMLGTFYRAPSPGAKPFVEVGDKVQPDDTVCLVEVMKLFNSVRSGIAGTIEGILVENGTLVEYGQPLILVRKDTT